MEDQAPQLPISAEYTEPTAPSASNMVAAFAAMEQKPAETPPAEKPAETTPPPADVGNTETPPAEETKPERAKWGELKSKAQERDELVTTKIPEYERKIAELEQKASQVVDTTKYDEQIRNLEKEKAKYEEIVAVKAVEESQQFQDTVIKPLRDIAAKTAHIAQAYGLAPADLQSAMQITDPAAQMQRLNELMVDFDGAHKAKIWEMSEKSQEHLAKAWDMQQNAMETKKELDFLAQQERQKVEQERSQKLSVSQKAVQDQFLKTLPDVFRDDAIKQQVFAAQITDDPVMATYNAYAGQALAVVVKDSRAKDAEIARLKGELAERASVAAKMGGASQQQGASPANPLPAGDSMFARAQAMGVPMASAR